MNYFKILFSTIFTFIILFSSAQEYNVEWGPVYKREGGMFSYFYVLGHEDDQYYLAMRPKKNYSLVTYDFDHKLKSTKEVEFNFDGTSLTPSSFIKTKAHTYAYMSDYNKKTKTSTVYKSVFDGGDFSELEKVDAGERTYKKYKYSKSINNSVGNDESIFLTSKDKSHFGTVLAYSEEDKKRPSHVQVTIMDEYLEEIYNADFKLPHSDEDLVIKDAVISNNGTIFMTALSYKERADREKGIPNYTYKILKVTKDEIESFDFVIGNDDVAPQEANLFVSDDSYSAYLGGFYTKREKRSGVNGVFFGEIDFKSGDVEANYEAFSDEFLEGLIRGKAIEKGKGVSTTYDIDHLITFEDGTFSFIAEQYYITRHTRTVNGVTTTYYIYHSNEIIIPRFEKDGTIVSLEKVDKEFQSTSQALTSYTYAFREGKIYLVYNDAKTRGERQETGSKGGRRARFTDITVIDVDGEIETQHTLFSNKEIETEFVPSYSFATKDALILGGVFKKGYQFGTIDMTE